MTNIRLNWAFKALSEGFDRIFVSYNPAISIFTHVVGATNQ